MNSPLAAAVAALLLALITMPAAAVPVPEPSGYRMDDYRHPVPETLRGGTVITPEQAHALWLSSEAAFVDVMPRPPKPDNLPAGTTWRDRPRNSIPGAIWLPNVGYGDLAPATRDYFRQGLDLASGGDRARTLVVFCLDNCWMSWNAAKRAVEWGYSGIYWFPEGTDGWKASGYPLERVKPFQPS